MPIEAPTSERWYEMNKTIIRTGYPEHDAWIATCDELEKLGIDINDHDRLAALLNMWGERLAQLRMTQEQEEKTGWKFTIEQLLTWESRA